MHLEDYSMQIGVSEFATTSPITNYATICGAGMDFVEIGLGKAALMSEVDFDAAAKGIAESGASVQSCNWFLPPELKVTGPDVDDNVSQAFLDLALPRAARLGAKAIVFGSPSSRSIPAGFDQAEGRRQIRAFCERVAESIAASGFDIRLAIEHVNQTETNCIPTLAEAIKLAREIDRPEVGVAIDFYHLVMESEPLEVILEAGDLACAVQLADPATRTFPDPKTNVPGLDRFFELLRQINYTGGVSVEATPRDDLAQSCRDAVAVLRPLVS